MHLRHWLIISSKITSKILHFCVSGGTYISPITQLLAPIEIEGIMSEPESERALPIIGITINERGVVVPVSQRASSKDDYIQTFFRLEELSLLQKQKTKVFRSQSTYETLSLIQSQDLNPKSLLFIFKLILHHLKPLWSLQMVDINHILTSNS